MARAPQSLRCKKTSPPNREARRIARINRIELAIGPERAQITFSGKDRRRGDCRGVQLMRGVVPIIPNPSERMHAWVLPRARSGRVVNARARRSHERFTDQHPSTQRDCRIIVQLQRNLARRHCRSANSLRGATNGEADVAVL